METISSLIAKGLKIYINNVFLFFICNKCAKLSKNLFLLCHYEEKVKVSEYFLNALYAFQNNDNFAMPENQSNLFTEQKRPDLKMNGLYPAVTPLVFGSCEVILFCYIVVYEPRGKIQGARLRLGRTR